MISSLDAEKYRLAEAAQRLGTHVSTLFRWSSKGIGGAKLRITRVGGRSYVLREDLERFIAARSDPAPASEPERDVHRRAIDAGQALGRLGL